MRNALSLFQFHIFQEGEGVLQSMVVGIQEMKAVDLIEGAAYSSKSCDEKGKDRRSWTARDSCSKNTKCSFEHNFSRKGKGKGQRSRGLAHRGKGFRHFWWSQEKIQARVDLEKMTDLFFLSARTMDLPVVANSVTRGIRRFVGMSK